MEPVLTMKMVLSVSSDTEQPLQKTPMAKHAGQPQTTTPGEVPMACGCGQHYTGVSNRYPMTIDTANAQPMGSLIIEAGHKPFHALACPLRPATVTISRKA